MAEADGARLKVKPELIDNRTGKRWRIYKNPTFVGRHRSCEICVPVVEISRRHCKIYEENEEYFIEDLQSVNGTFINEEPVSGKRKLVDGFHIKIGKCAKFPGGAKDFVWRHPKPKIRVKETEESASESDRLVSGVVMPKTQIPLRHCVFRLAKKAVLGAETKTRIPLQKLGGKDVHFLSMVPYRPGDVLTLSIEHPKIEPPIQMALKVARVLSVKGKGVQVYRIETQIAKFATKEQERFKQAIEVTALMKYNFLSQAEAGDTDMLERPPATVKAAAPPEKPAAPPPPPKKKPKDEDEDEDFDPDEAGDEDFDMDDEDLGGEDD